ncbi:hypothetical protein ATI02_4336 [Pseudomonas baetica]|uniref:Uncharacterized protein n=1 Tax=Pseudomonas baetica TaxID=674054 RepID=A0ABX4Q3N0_9PSED|nr:hypothetical protein [Pseudomonas baetica]PKA71358.1 hypothetical protein ATI02_4336 [Pseudomonas baetica]PTC19856.1 hypothetical protein C0J26_07615 [Pseudomonas baetica]
MAGAKSSEADRENKQKIQQAKFGKKFESMSRDTIHTTKGLAAVVYYQISESDYLSEKGIVQKAPSSIFSNISLPNPNIYYGQPCYEKKKWEYSYAVAESFLEHFMATATPEEIKQFNHNQNLKGATASERDEILKAYLVYDHLLTLDPKEAAKLSESEQVELLFAMRERFTLEFTREKKLNHLIQAVPHIKYETETGLYKSHLHILMSSKSYDRKNLDLHNSGLRMFWALNALENDPKFSKSLLPTNTNAARDRFIPTSEAEYKKFRNRMKVILKGATKENIQQILDKHGITITDFPEPIDGTAKSGADKFVVRMDGKAFNMKYLMDREKTLLESHQLYDKASNKTQLVMHDVANLIKSKKHQSITELDAALRKMNVYLLPLITAKGQIQGFSLYVADTDTKCSGQLIPDTTLSFFSA